MHKHVSIFMQANDSSKTAALVCTSNNPMTMAEFIGYMEAWISTQKEKFLRKDEAFHALVRSGKVVPLRKGRDRDAGRDPGT